MATGTRQFVNCKYIQYTTAKMMYSKCLKRDRKQKRANSVMKRVKCVFRATSASRKSEVKGVQWKNWTNA